MSTDWVEKAITPPDAPVLSAKLRLPPYTTLATKPMCRYPAYPHYVGGDPRARRCLPLRRELKKLSAVAMSPGVWLLCRRGGWRLR